MTVQKVATLLKQGLKPFLNYLKRIDCIHL